MDPVMNLFAPLDIREVRLRNRIVVSPMCMYSSQDGFANEWHVVHLGSRAVGGAGIIFTEAAAVEARGRITAQDLGIYDDAHVETLRRITGFIREHGAVAGIQLAHAGRKAGTSPPWDGSRPVDAAEGGWTPVGPSPLPFAEGHPAPGELDEDGIRGVVRSFREATRRALDAGFQIAEIHAAHGYLLHEFLSPLSNRRTDGYGGEFKNRIRIVCETVTAVREVWPERLPLFVRISATDWAPGGWDPEQSVELSSVLKGMGVDLIDCSSGGNVPQASIPAGPGYQVAFAERVRRQAGIMTGAVGLIVSPHQADQILRTGQADLVFLAREMLRNPYWPLYAAKELHREVNPPVQYARAW